MLNTAAVAREALKADADIVLVCAGLFGVGLMRMPYGFYTLSRLVVCASCTYVAFRANQAMIDDRRNSGIGRTETNFTATLRPSDISGDSDAGLGVHSRLTAGKTDRKRHKAKADIRVRGVGR